MPQSKGKVYATLWSSRTAAAPAPPPPYNPLTAIAWHSAFWADDPAWSHPTSGAAVPSWRNGGTNGTPLTQGTVANQPTYRGTVASFGQHATVQGDGANDILNAAFTPLAQPLSVVAVCNIGPVGGQNYPRVFGTANDVGTCEVYVSGGSSFILQAGAALPGYTLANPSAPHLFVAKIAGAASSLSIDGTVRSTGNAGAGSLNGVGLMGAQPGSLHSGNYAFVGVYPGDVAALPAWPAFCAWVTANYGITTTPAPPAKSLTYLQHTGIEQGAPGITSFTFSGVNFGAPAAGRVIVAAFSSRQSPTTATTIPSVTIGGVAATQCGIASSDAPNPFSTLAVFAATVPTGATGDVVVTYSQQQLRCGLDLWTAQGIGAPLHAVSSGADPASLVLNTAAGGVAVAAAQEGTSGPVSFTWTNATERYDGLIAPSNAGGRGMSAADTTTTAGTRTIGCVCTGLTNRVTLAVSW